MRDNANKESDIYDFQQLDDIVLQYSDSSASSVRWWSFGDRSPPCHLLIIQALVPENEEFTNKHEEFGETIVGT